MRIPQIVMGTAVLVLVILLFSGPRHRVPVYSASNEQAVQGVVQGLTAERVLVHADTKVHPDLLNSHFGYVAISRASDEATLFTDDAAKLAKSSSSLWVSR